MPLLVVLLYGLLFLIDPYSAKRQGMVRDYRVSLALFGVSFMLALGISADWLPPHLSLTLAGLVEWIIKK